MPYDGSDRRKTANPELVAIHARLTEGDRRMNDIEHAVSVNTAITQQIAKNTAGFIAFSEDLASGSRFMCRVAKGVQFILKDIVDPYWKPALVVSLAVWMVTHNYTIPGWVSSLIKVIIG